MSIKKPELSISNPFLVLLTVIFLITFLGACQQKAPIDFSTQVKPILNNKCISCHGGVKKQGGFSLLFEEEAFAKLESGKYGIIPGNPAESEMIRRLHLEDPEERMPYDEEPLESEEIAILTQWIEEGAKWGQHWAYTSIQPKAFYTSNTSTAEGIDQLIQSQQKKAGIKHSPKADPITLSRRLSLDLIGLPAPDSLLQNYLSQPTDEHFEQLVDQLLALPHFGERWTAMWLDLARYADTKGYERDGPRKIWRYRDWLIQAFNQDMPYDQFITEQLAGDLLDQASDEQLIATAFHRNSMTNDEGGTNNEEFRTAAVLDRVNTTWEVLLGTSFACAQCHSHPYDPFTQENYYQFSAYFNNTRDEDSYADYPLLRHFDSTQIADLQKLKQTLASEISTEETQEIIHFLKTWTPARNSLTCDQFKNAELSDTKWLAMRNNGSARLQNVNLTNVNSLIVRHMSFHKGGTWMIRLNSPEGPIIGQRKVRDVQVNKGWKIDEVPINAPEGIHDVYFTYRHPQQYPAGHKENDRKHIRFDWFYFTQSLPKQKDINEPFWKLLRANVPSTPIMQENPKDLKRSTHLFERGNWLLKSQKVQAGTPASLAPVTEEFPSNRLGLAQWMCDPQNPLTARTVVNRIWEQFFGFGIVETLEDLGTQGAIPTNQELLDFLSYRLTHEYQWSLKSLMKAIVMSETYQQSSVVQKNHLEKDPNNLYLARMPRIRLSAEQIRDQALMVSGVFNPEMYGPPVMPYQPDGVWSSPYDGSKWVQSEGKNQYRRAIYTYWKRTSPYPSMITFDGVGREVCVSRRIRTNTPLQALATLNDQVFMDLSIQLAQRIWDQEKDIDNAIKTTYQQVTRQEIDPERLAILRDLFQEAKAEYSNEPTLLQEMKNFTEKEIDSELAALALVANAILNLDEVIMKS